MPSIPGCSIPSAPRGVVNELSDLVRACSSSPVQVQHAGIIVNEPQTPTAGRPASTLADEADDRLPAHPQAHHPDRDHGRPREHLDGPARDHAAGEREDDGHHHPAAEWFDVARIALVAIAAALVWFRVWEPYPRVSIIGLAATLVGGWPIFREAVENLVERRMTMELSMTIALVAALV
ncbi:MAG TPA: hypothetical protein VFP28_05120, partial [Gemmatimonadales bacterium]|nr:hypothetical protein [Gemmatimonadales bacterium]